MVLAFGKQIQKEEKGKNNIVIQIYILTQKFEFISGDFFFILPLSLEGKKKTFSSSSLKMKHGWQAATTASNKDYLYTK